MASINNKQIIDDLIAKNGYYPGDPQVIKIVEYTNAWGKKTWGIVYVGEDTERYNRATEYVQRPKTIWEAPPPPKGHSVFHDENDIDTHYYECIVAEREEAAKDVRE